MSGTSKKTFFDLLPFDVCVNLAERAARDPINRRTSSAFSFPKLPFYSESALALSEINPRLLEAVRLVCSPLFDVDILFNHFYTDRSIENWSNESWYYFEAIVLAARYISEWKIIPFPNLRHLVIEKFWCSQASLSAAARRDVLFLLSGPKLHRVEISNDPTQLQAVEGSASIRDLSIRLFHRDVNIFEANRFLHLASLRLICTGNKCSECSFKGLASLNEGVVSETTNAGPFSCCPNIISLSLTCGSHEKDYSGSEVVRDMVCKFATLHRITLENMKASSETVSMLRNLDSVRIFRTEKALHLARELKSNITVLKTDEGLNNDQILQLENCRSLTRLEIALKEDAGEALPAALCGLNSLHTLKLNWKKAIQEEEEPPFLNEARVDEIFPGLIYDISNAVPSLRELFLSSVLICDDEMVEVMEHMGERLEKLQVPMKFNGRNTFVWLENILQAVLDYNSNLTILYVFLVEGEVTRDLFLEATDSHERSIQKERLMKLLKCLKRSNPRCQTAEVELLIDFVFEGRNEIFFIAAFLNSESVGLSL